MRKLRSKKALQTYFQDLTAPNVHEIHFQNVQSLHAYFKNLFQGSLQYTEMTPLHGRDVKKRYNLLHEK